MTMTTDELKGTYSPMEKAIFAVLQKQGSATSDMLLHGVYRKGEKPFNAQIVVNRAVNTLSQKLKLNREAYRLDRKRLPRQRLIENRLVKKLAKETA